MSLLPLASPNRTPDFQLRPYQREAIQAVKDHWESDEKTGAMLVLATGCGKTATAMALAVEFLERGQRVVWLAMRQELLDQPRDTLAAFWPDHGHRSGIVQADRDRPDAQIVFASVQTVINDARMEAILAHGYPDLVVFDEAHHQVSPTAKAATDALCAKGALRLGLTATPERQDLVDLSEDWTIAYSFGITEAIAAGYLVEPYAAVERLPDLDLSRVSGRRDFDSGELAAELLRSGIVEHAVEMMERTHVAFALPDREESRYLTAKGRACLVFVPTVDMAEKVSAALRDAGWRARHVSGLTPKEERRRLIGAFKRGLIDVLVNVGVLVEGTDLPRACCIVLCRPTRSRTLFIQALGRGLRLFKDKTECFVLDLAGATEDHSILAPPVLIGETRCPKSPNGSHDFVSCEDPRDGARCSHCNRKAACGINFGPHTWGDNDHCTACQRPRCVESDDARHGWLPQADHTRTCLYCGVSVPDPLAGMVRKRREETVVADWVRVPNLEPETYVVDCGTHGLLFVVGCRTAGEWRAYWLKKGGRKAYPLSHAPLPTAHVRGYADYIVARAAKVAAKSADWKSKRPDSYLRTKALNLGVMLRRGETAGDLSRRLLRQHARERAIRTGIAKEA